MVPKIHAKGASFKGAAAYLLHDKDRAQTADRVAWTQARNLAVDDPDMAWRIMAATAMDQSRLKSEAGVKNTGRKSAKHVLHVSLAWHPDQDPSQEEMAIAADQALKALGAQDRQALIVAHNDEKHRHLHLLINRVSPQDGRHLSSSKDRLKLSKWAEAYERDGGKIYCEDRVVNNAMRERGEYVKGEPDMARHMYEALGPSPAPANDNDQVKAARDAQRKKDAALVLKSRNLTAMRAKAWEHLQEAHKERKAALMRQLARGMAKAKIAAREEFRPKWRDLYREQNSEKLTFEALEESFFGRASNMAKAIKISAEDIGNDKSGIIGRTFGILTNAGKRREYFDAAQERAQKALQRDQDAKVSEARKSLTASQAAKLADQRANFVQEREHLIKSQEAERSRVQEEWQTRNVDRQAALREAAQKAVQREAVKEAHRKAAAPPPHEPQTQRGDDKSPASSVRQPEAEKPTAPQTRQDRIAEFLKRSRAKEQDNAPTPDQDRDDDIDI